MTVYVDDVRHHFGRMIMCHMWADTVLELHAFADRLGLKRSWFQEPPKASWQHYDISIGKKIDAIKMGAVLTDKYGPFEHIGNQLLKSSHHMDIEEGHRKLEWVKEQREKAIARSKA